MARTHHLSAVITAREHVTSAESYPTTLPFISMALAGVQPDPLEVLVGIAKFLADYPQLQMSCDYTLSDL